LIEIQLPYPVSANVYWRTFRGITVVSPRAIEYRKSVKALCYVAGIQPLDGDIALFLELCAKKPKKQTGKRPRCMDLSNAIKVAEDAMQGACFWNDSQVRKLCLEFGEPIYGGCLLVRIEQL
jgi:crossover junction endodeoxyribonuclease RusA